MIMLRSPVLQALRNAVVRVAMRCPGAALVALSVSAGAAPDLILGTASGVMCKNSIVLILHQIRR
jgi:hypothetical protein